MLSFVLMAIATVLGVFLLIEMKRLDQVMVVEIIICSGWSKRFQKQTKEEEKEDFLFSYGKYHHVKERRRRKRWLPGIRRSKASGPRRKNICPERGCPWRI